MKKLLFLLYFINAVFIACTDPLAPVTEKPKNPANLGVEVLSGSNVRLTWDDRADNEEGFFVYRHSSSTRPFEYYQSLSANQQSLEINGLSPGQMYYFWVGAYNSAGESDYIRTNAFVEASPAAPTAFTVSNDSVESFFFSWQDESGNETDFLLAYNTENQRNTATEIVLDPDSESYSLSGMTAGQQYYFFLKARNDQGDSDELYIEQQLISVPLAPTGLTSALSGQSNLDIQWNDEADNETAYELSYSDSSANSHSLTLGSNVESAVIHSLNPYEIYTIHLRAINGGGRSDTVSITAAAGQPPGPVALTSITTNGVDVNITWEAASNVTQYLLYRSTTSSKPSFPLHVLAGDVLSFSFKGLAEGTEFYFWVEAYNPNGQTVSSSLQAETLFSPVVIDLFWINYAGHLDARWEAGSGVDGYRYYFGNDPVKENNPIFGVNDASTHTPSVGNVSAYYFKPMYLFVEATNANGSVLTVYSNVSDVSSTSADLRTSSLNGTSTTLTWDNVSPVGAYSLWQSTANSTNRPLAAFDMLRDTGSSTLSRDIEDLQPETDYRFWLGAHGEGIGGDQLGNIADLAILDITTPASLYTNFGTNALITVNVPNTGDYEGDGFDFYNEAVLIDGSKSQDNNASAMWGLNDGEMGTVAPFISNWNTNNAEAVDTLEVILDLQQEIELAQIQIVFQSTATRAKIFSLEGLADGEDPETATWFNLATVLDNSDDKPVFDFTTTSESLRYVRLSIDDPVSSSPNPQWGLKMSEIVVLGQ